MTRGTKEKRRLCKSCNRVSLVVMQVGFLELQIFGSALDFLYALYLRPFMLILDLLYADLAFFRTINNFYLLTKKKLTTSRMEGKKKEKKKKISPNSLVWILNKWEKWSEIKWKEENWYFSPPQFWLRTFLLKLVGDISLQNDGNWREIKRNYKSVLFDSRYFNTFIVLKLFFFSL